MAGFSASKPSATGPTESTTLAFDSRNAGKFPTRAVRTPFSESISSKRADRPVLVVQMSTRRFCTAALSRYAFKAAKGSAALRLMATLKGVAAGSVFKMSFAKGASPLKNVSGLSMRVSGGKAGRSSSCDRNFQRSVISVKKRCSAASVSPYCAMTASAGR